MNFLARTTWLELPLSNKASVGSPSMPTRRTVLDKQAGEETFLST